MRTPARERVGATIHAVCGESGYRVIAFDRRGWGRSRADSATGVAAPFWTLGGGRVLMLRYRHRRRGGRACPADQTRGRDRLRRRSEPDDAGVRNVTARCGPRLRSRSLRRRCGIAAPPLLRGISSTSREQRQSRLDWTYVVAPKIRRMVTAGATSQHPHARLLKPNPELPGALCAGGPVRQARHP
jgi:hypothetical protein